MMEAEKWTEAQEIIAFAHLQQGNAIIAIYLLRIISVPDILSGNYENPLEAIKEYKAE